MYQPKWRTYSLKGYLSVSGSLSGEPLRRCLAGELRRIVPCCRRYRSRALVAAAAAAAVAAVVVAVDASNKRLHAMGGG